MLIRPDCITCILNMVLSTFRELKISEKQIKSIFENALTIPALRGESWEHTSPELIELIMNNANTVLGNTDPFREIKQQLNRQVLQMLPLAEGLINDAEDPVYSAVKLAILGNSIDFMVPGGTAAIESSIMEKLKTELDKSSYSIFFNKLNRAKKIVYFTDNCGEIILDKLLIRVLKQQFNMDITVVVRHLPTLNDATLKEAKEIGLTRITTVIDNGMDGPFPGTVLGRCSQEVREIVDQADLVIAKGGGNFDSLEGQLAELKTDITFLLLAKCHPIRTYLDTDLFKPVIANFYRPV